MEDDVFGDEGLTVHSIAYLPSEREPDSLANKRGKTLEIKRIVRSAVTDVDGCKLGSGLESARRWHARSE